MKEKTVQKITLICAVVASLFINIDFRLFFLFQMNEVKQIIQEQSWKKDFAFLQNNKNFSYKIDSDLPAIIIFNNQKLTTPQDTIWLDMRSSDELKNIPDEQYELILKEINDRGLYEYYLGINDLTEGVNDAEIILEDKYGYTSARSFYIEYDYVQILGVTSDRDEVIVPDGDSLNTKIDGKYGLSYDYIPSDLVSLCDCDVSCLNGDKQLRQAAAENLKNLVDDALSEGVYLYVLSAYRSFNHQLDLYNFVYRRDGEEHARRSAALPGHSEHQLGTAVDFTSSEMINGKCRDFSYTSASRWLALNAYKYGFVLSFPADYSDTTGIMYEPWHYRYVGVETAKEIRKSGKIPIEYLREIQDEENSS